MTPQELTSEKEYCSTSLVPVEEDFSCDLTLETYLEALCINESHSPALDEIASGSARRRSRALDLAVKKLALMEFKGKEYVEEYVRCQHRSCCSPNTIRNSRQGLEGFIMYLQATGKRDLTEMERRDIEGFVEDEQDQGLKLSTVKTRLAIVKAFLCFMAEKGLIREEVFPWKLKI